MGGEVEDSRRVSVLHVPLDFGFNALGVKHGSGSQQFGNTHSFHPRSMQSSEGAVRLIILCAEIEIRVGDHKRTSWCPSPFDNSAEQITAQVQVADIELVDEVAVVIEWEGTKWKPCKVAIGRHKHPTSRTQQPADRVLYRCTQFASRLKHRCFFDRLLPSSHIACDRVSDRGQHVAQHLRRIVEEHLDSFQDIRLDHVAFAG